MLIRLPIAAQMSGVSPLTAKRHWKAGLFPKPVKIGVRAIAFPAAEVEAVATARIAGKTDDEIRVIVANLERQRTAVAA